MTPGSFVRGVSAMSPRLPYLPTSLHCGVCRYLRRLQRGAAESATGAGHTLSLWHVESALWSVQVPAVSAMRSCGERKVLPVLSAMSPCLVPAGKSTVPSV